MALLDCQAVIVTIVCNAVHGGMLRAAAICSALRDAGIPPGPRLLILHHVDTVRRGMRAGQPYAAPAQR